MEASAYIKNVPMSPKKLRFLAVEVRALKPSEAIKVLNYTNKKGARILHDAIASAVANAKNTLRTSEDLLQFKALIIEEGMKMRRFRAGSKGMAKPYVRAFSHVKVILTTTGRVNSATKEIVSKDAAAADAVEKKENVKNEAVAKSAAAKPRTAAATKVAKPKQAEKPKPQRVSRKGM